MKPARTPIVADHAPRPWRRALLFIVGAALNIALATPAAAAVTSITPNTWNIIGLDSNTPAFGPYRFPVGARVCSDSAGPVSAELHWESGGTTDDNSVIRLRLGSLNPVLLDFANAGDCLDAYFEVEVTRNDGSFNQTRRYFIEAGGLSTPRPRELKVERLVSQSRNAITRMEFGTSLAAMTTVANGGSMNLVVGETYYIRMSGYTATQGYEQLESFIGFPNTIFQVLSVNSQYSADTSATVANPNPQLYADGCAWENDPNSPNYLACNAEGKAGGSVVVTYKVAIVGGGGTRETLNSLIHDFSGSSFHYNADFSTSVYFANLIDPTSVTIAKNFAPDPIPSGGVSTLTFTLANPNAGAVSNVNFVDVFPTLPGAMTVAVPLTVSNSCGGTLRNSADTASLAAGDTGLKLVGATIPAYNACTVKVNVTAPAQGSYTNTTQTLRVGLIDTGKTATDTLVVDDNAVPPPPPPPALCTTPKEIARWDMTTTTVTSKAADVVTATASSTGGTFAISTTEGNPANSWGGRGWYPNPTGPPAFPSAVTAPWVDFTLDTSKYGGVRIQFDYAMLGNGDWGGPNDNRIYVYTNPDGGGFSTAATINGSKGSWQTGLAANAVTTGTSSTVFRINATGAAANKPNATFYLDNVVFYGCKYEPPTLVKAFSPNPVAVGDTSTLTFTVTNPNPGDALTGIAFDDDLPAGLTVTSGSAAVCGGTLTRTAPNKLSFSGGALAGGASCNIIATVTAAEAGTHSNISGFVKANESGANTTATGSAKASLVALLPPSIVKEFDPNPFLTSGAGGYSTLTFTIVNPNPDAAIGNVAFTDTFPVAPGPMVVANPLWTGNTCGGSLQDNVGGVLAAGDAGIRLINGTIAAGASCTVSVNVATATAGSYLNTSGNVSHQVPAGTTRTGNAATAEVVAKTPVVAISLLKQVGFNNIPSGPGSAWSSFLAVPAGGSVYYKLTVENLGDAALNPVTVSDPQLNAQIAACTWYRDVYDGNLATFDLPVRTAIAGPLTLPVAAPEVDSSAHCIIGPVTAVAGSIPNTATASGTAGGTIATDSSTARYATTSLSVVKTATESYFLAENDELHYQFAVTNNGFAALRGPVAVADDKTGNESCPPVASVGDGDSYLDPGETLVCTASYTVVAADVTARLVTNKATATAGGVTSPETSLTVPLGPDLLAVKTNDALGILAPPATFNWTLTVSNAPTAGMAATFADTQVLLTDDLPATGVTYALANDPNPTPAARSAGVTGAGVVNCLIAANTLTCAVSGGEISLPPGESVSIVVAVTVNSGGSLVNPRSGGICRTDPGAAVAEINDEGHGTDNNACADTVSAGTPSLTMLKLVQPHWDPVNGNFPNARAIPGALVTYTIMVTNSGYGAADADSIVITDRIPANTELFVGDIDAPGSGPVRFTDGATASGLSYSFLGLGDATDSLSFSNNGAADYNYAPTADGNGCDQGVTHLKVLLSGPFNGTADGVSNPSFSLDFRARIK